VKTRSIARHAPSMGARFGHTLAAGKARGRLSGSVQLGVGGWDEPRARAGVGRGASRDEKLDSPGEFGSAPRQGEGSSGARADVLEPDRLPARGRKLSPFGF